jgi:hypothetical protein
MIGGMLEEMAEHFQPKIIKKLFEDIEELEDIEEEKHKKEQQKSIRRGQYHLFARKEENKKPFLG